MKKTILLFIILVSSLTYAQKKINYSSIAEYSLIKQIDATDIKTKQKTENYTLYLNDSISLFISNNRIGLDTILYNSNFSDIEKLRNLPKPTSNKRILKRIGSQKMRIYNEFYDKTYKYDDNVVFNWEILNSFDSISGLKVRKAITKFRGRKYIAWYTDEIPISDGPYKFKGLPGIIVKLYDLKEQIVFTLIKFKNFKKNKYLIFDYDEEVVETTMNKYKKASKTFKLNPIPLMESAGSVFDEKTKRLIRERFRKKYSKNNPIELDIR